LKTIKAAREEQMYKVAESEMIIKVPNEDYVCDGCTQDSCSTPSNH